MTVVPKDIAALRRLWESRLVAWLCVCLWMAVIFAFSNQAHSGEITGQYLGPSNILVRKCAHMFEYGVLFLLARRAFGMTELPFNGRSGIWPLLLAVLYAASDEFHQSFVPGRSATPFDVAVDSCGAAIAWLAVRYLPPLRSFWSRTRS